MDEAGEAVLIFFLVFFILGFLVWLCSYHNRRLISPREKLPLLYGRLKLGIAGSTRVRASNQEPFIGVKYGRLFSWKTPSLRDLVIKRCGQSSTFVVENRVINVLRQDLHYKGLDLVDRDWDQALDNGGKPVIVFCVISSRIGTDIENAIRGVHGRSRIILVLLHCILSSLLRGDLFDDEELLDTTLRSRMTSIAHFAFSDREGLYDCHQNRVGFEKLLNAVSLL